MGYSAFTDNQIQGDKAVRQELWQKVKDNDEYLYYAIAAMQAGGTKMMVVLNPFLENDLNVDQIPDSWTRYLYPGGTGQYATISDSKIYCFAHPGGAGNGGGYLTSDYIEMSSFWGVLKNLGFVLWSTVAGIKNQVIVEFYSNNKVYISSNTIYDSVANPTARQSFIATIGTIPDYARYIKIKLVGGESSVDVAGTTYFTGISVNPSTEMTTEMIVSATIAEGYTANTVWIDVNSVVIPLPIFGLVNIGFEAEIRTTNVSATASQRFRIGSVYSNENSTVSVSYMSNYYKIENIYIASSSITLIQQLMRAAGSAFNVYGKKSIPKTNIKYII